MSERLSRLAQGAPVVARLMVGGMMIVHGADKLAGEPAMFGTFLDEQLLSTGGVLGWLVILLEFVGGMFLVVGSRHDSWPCSSPPSSSAPSLS